VLVDGTRCRSSIQGGRAYANVDAGLSHRGKPKGGMPAEISSGSAAFMQRAGLDNSAPPGYATRIRIEKFNVRNF